MGRRQRLHTHLPVAVAPLIVRPSDSPVTGQRLSVEHLSASYGSEKVLDDVSVDFLIGEIHALLGPNGSGKSTLVKVAGGVLPGSSVGEFELPNGLRTSHISPTDAERAGLRFIHQDLGLVPDLTVTDNLYLSNPYPRRGGLIQWSACRKQVVRVLSLLGIELPPNARVGDLSHNQRVLVALGRAVMALPATGGLLFVDEPTAALDESDSVWLLKHLKSLVSAAPVGVCLITHRLREVLKFADRVTVLKDGRVVLRSPIADITEGSLLRALGGARSPREEGPREPARLRLDSLRDLSWTVFFTQRISALNLMAGPGEIVGVTGLADSGKDDLVEVLSGLKSPRSGSVRIDGLRVDLRSPAKATRCGIGVVPADRRQLGAVNELPVAYNLLLPSLRRFSRHWWYRAASARAAADELVERYGVRPADPKRLMGELSGGNQQKVIFGRWLSTELRLLVLHEPTAGVDVTSRERLYELARQSASAGLCILVISSDPVELEQLCDRVLIMSRGRIVTELAGTELDAESVLLESFKATTQPEATLGADPRA